MTTKRIYVCNFCRDEKPMEEMHGLYWMAGDTLEKRPAIQCENHLCLKCLFAITQTGKEYEAMRPVAS